MSRVTVLPPEKKSVFKLVGELPGLISTLIRDEIESIKQELTTRLKAAGIGIGLFAGAAVFGYFGTFALLATVILVLALWLPAWAAALIVTVLLFIVAGILALLGVRRVQRGVPPVSQSSIDSVKSDVQAFKGVGQYDR
jgi:tetrahydromethanopterin S-methyltransferase subunit C